METKRCARCGETKPTTEFGSNRRNPDGLHSYCRSCINAYMNARYVKRPKRERPPLPELKRCSRCGQEKPRSDFRKAAKGNRAADGLFGWCRPCANEYAREKAQAESVRTGRQRPQRPPDGFRRCSMCKETKPLADFYPSKHTRDGRRAYCRKCWHEAPSIQEAYRRYRRSKTFHDRLKRRRRDDPEFRRKDLVRKFTGIAAELGIIKRQPCEVCGDPKVQAHHTDYAKPLEVRWLCKTHHQSHGHAGDFDNPPQ